MTFDWRRLLKRPAERRDSEIYRAAATNASELARLLDADPSLLKAEGPFGRQPLHAAAAAGNEECVRLLLSRGASPHAIHHLFRTTPLHHAVEADSGGCVDALLSAGGDPNAADSLGETPVFYASSVAVIERLRTAGAEVGVTTLAGKTPVLCSLTNSKSIEVLEFWLNHGVDVNHVPWFGWPALHAACSTAYLKCGIEQSIQIPMLRLLLAHGAYIDLRDHSGKTALYTACQFGFAECVRFLLANGADPNLPSAPDTPLDIAVLMRRQDIIELLLAHGANPSNSMESSDDR